MSKGGMQSSAVKYLLCKCGKETSKILKFADGTEISIHFTRKSTYWHIVKDGNIKRVFKQPDKWE